MPSLSVTFASTTFSLPLYIRRIRLRRETIFIYHKTLHGDYVFEAKVILANFVTLTQNILFFFFFFFFGNFQIGTRNKRTI